MTTYHVLNELGECIETGMTAKEACSYVYMMEYVDVMSFLGKDGKWYIMCNDIYGCSMPYIRNDIACSDSEEDLWRNFADYIMSSVRHPYSIGITQSLERCCD